MNTKQLMKLMKAIAALNPEGFTFSPSSKRFPRKGYVVASRHTQNNIGNIGLFNVVKFYLKHTDYYIGVWRNENDLMQYDASMIYDSLEEAVKAAIANHQRAFYDLYTKNEIPSSDYYHLLSEKLKAA